MINKSIEIWMQDTQNLDLWHSEEGLIVNTAALKEREDYFDVHRVLAVEPYLNMRNFEAAGC